MRFALVSLLTLVTSAQAATTDLNAILSAAAGQISDVYNGFSDLGDYYSDLGDYYSDLGDVVSDYDYESYWDNYESAINQVWNSGYLSEVISFYGRSDVSRDLTAVDAIQSNTAALSRWYFSFYSKYKTDLDHIYSELGNPFTLYAPFLSGLSDLVSATVTGEDSTGSATRSATRPTQTGSGTTQSSGSGSGSGSGTVAPSAASEASSSSEAASGSSTSAGSDGTRPLMAFGALLGSFSFLLL